MPHTLDLKPVKWIVVACRFLTKDRRYLLRVSFCGNPHRTHMCLGWLLAAVDELYPRFFPFALKRFRVLRCGASLL